MAYSCEVCGSTKIRYTKRTGPAREGKRETTDSEGRKKLSKCTGPAERFCRKHSPTNKKD